MPSPTVINLTGKKRWLMHDDLHILLPDAVYTVLDSNSHLPADKRFKLQEACKKSNTSALFDPATGAPFGHQFQLSLAEGAHFDPVKRGLALAVAGRSAGLEPSAGGSLIDATGRRSVLLEFRNHWSSIEADFGSAHELSGPNVNRLWEGVSFVMQARAARATAWGYPEVELACTEQYEALAAYWAAVAASVSRAASAFQPATAPARSTRRTSASFSHSGGNTSFCAPASTRLRRPKPPRRSSPARPRRPTFRRLCPPLQLPRAPRPGSPGSPPARPHGPPGNSSGNRFLPSS
jgi:hypothetical protein